MEELVEFENERRPVRAAWWVFLRQWLKSPLQVSSATPSGRQLASLMARTVPADAERVVELGAGTGVITRQLLDRGIDPSRLLVVEMNEVLHDLLRRSFPCVQVVCGDARYLEQLLDESDGSSWPSVDAVVSSLGLLAMPMEVQHDILASAFAVLRPGGVFIQYTYGAHHPLPEDVCKSLGLQCEYVGLAWRNLPPARVFVYRRC